MNLRRRHVVTFAAVAAAVVALPGAALAAFGSGTANPRNTVSAATIAPVNTVTALPQSTTSINVSWTVPNSQAPGVEYEVIDNTTSTTVCASLTSSTMNCTDNSVLPGQTYSYSVTAYIPSTAWTASPAPVSGTTPDVYGLSLSPIAPETAGTQFSLTVKAEKATSATNSTLTTDTGYAGSKSVTFGGPAASPNGTLPKYNGSTGTSINTAVTTSLTFTTGSVTVPVTLYDATTATAISAVTGSGGTEVQGQTGSFAVNAGSLNSFALSNPGAQTAGVSFNETVSALDTWSNPAAGWTSTTACVAFSGPASSPSPISTAPAYPAPGACASGSSLSFNASGQATASVTLDDAQTTSLTATSVTSPASKTGGSASFTVSAGSLAGIDLTGVTMSPSPSLSATGSIGSALTYSSAGEATNSGNALTASIQLVDAYGNAYTLPSGSDGIDLSVPTSGTGKDGTVSPSGANALTVSSGSSVTSASFTLTRSTGSRKTVTMTATIHGTTQQFTVTLAS